MSTHDIRKQREREQVQAIYETASRNPIPEGALGEQEGGSHYRDMRIQPVEFIHANNIGFLEGNAIKYLCRHRSKNGAEDLRKARHYIDLLLQLEYEEGRGE